MAYKGFLFSSLQLSQPDFFLLFGLPQPDGNWVPELARLCRKMKTAQFHGLNTQSQSHTDNC